MPNVSPSPCRRVMWDGGMKAKQWLIAHRLLVSIDVRDVLLQCAQYADIIDVYTCEGSRLRDRPSSTLQKGYIRKNIQAILYSNPWLAAT